MLDVLEGNFYLIQVFSVTVHRQMCFVSRREADFTDDRAWSSESCVLFGTFNGFFTFESVVFWVIDLAQRIVIEVTRQFLWDLAIFFIDVL